MDEPYGRLAPGKTWPPFVVPISGSIYLRISAPEPLELDPNELATCDPNMKNRNARPSCISGLGSMTKTQKTKKANNNTRLLRGKVARLKDPPPPTRFRSPFLALLYGDPVLLLIVWDTNYARGCLSTPSGRMLEDSLGLRMGICTTCLEV